MKNLTVLLGYELTTGREVRIPVRHMAVTGITQESGKTTTLEALIGRSGLRAVTFVTKRDEGSFTTATRIPAYFREHTDWRFVESLLEALLQQKMKFERSWIMRVCRGAKTLREVQANIDKAREGAKSGLDDSVFLMLSEYFEQLIPEIERLPYSKELKLGPGINVIDVSQYSTHLQGLVIRSVLEWVYEKEHDVIVLIPEAWEFVPQRHNSPVKDAAVQLIRKGAAGGKYVWLDSQDLAGVDKEIIKQVSVYVLGVQREVNEVKRTLAHLPGGAQRLKPEQIMKLSRGWFYVAFGAELRCVYVQPAWLDADPQRARQFAIEDLPDSYVARPETKRRHVTLPAESKAHTILPGENVEQALARVKRSETTMSDQQRRDYEKLLAYAVREFKDDMAGRPAVDLIFVLLEELKDRRRGTQEPAGMAPSMNAIVTEVIERLKKFDFPSLQVLSEKPELNVTVRRKVIDLDGSTLKGKLAQMVAEGWFDKPVTGNAAYVELQRRGFSTAKPNVYREMDKLAEWGFVTKEASGGFQAVEGMKVNIREEAA